MAIRGWYDRFDSAMPPAEAADSCGTRFTESTGTRLMFNLCLKPEETMKLPLLGSTSFIDVRCLLGIGLFLTLASCDPSRPPFSTDVTSPEIGPAKEEVNDDVEEIEGMKEVEFDFSNMDFISSAAGFGGIYMQISPEVDTAVKDHPDEVKAWAFANLEDPDKFAICHYILVHTTEGTTIDYVTEKHMNWQYLRVSGKGGSPPEFHPEDIPKIVKGWESKLKAGETSD